MMLSVNRYLISLCLIAILLSASLVSFAQDQGASNQPPEPTPDQMADQFFAQFAAKDKVTLQAFLEHAKSQFESMDSNGDGVLTRDEFIAHVKKERAIAARIKPKMQEVQQYVMSLLQNGGDFSKVSPLMKKLHAAANAGKPEEVEKYLDEILALKEKGKNKP